MRGHALAEYFISEVLERQPAEVAQFMLDTSVLSELTASVCAAIAERGDAAALLRSIDSANLFMVALDDDRTSYRYHHLVRQVLHAELRARDRPREQAMQLRAGEWYESTGETRRAAHHLLAARQADRALALMQDRVVADFLRDPALPPAPDLSTVDPTLLANAPERLLGLAADLLLSGDLARGGQYLDLLQRTQPPIIPGESRLAARFASLRCVRHALIGQADNAVAEALTARAILARIQVTDEWTAALPVILMRAYSVAGGLPGNRARGSRGSCRARTPRTGQARAGARRPSAGMVRVGLPGAGR